MQWLLSSGLTAGSLLLFVGLLIYTGKLVPGKTVDRLTKQADESAALWRRVAEKQSDRADLAVAQTEKLLTGLATVEALLRALSPPGKGRR